MSKPMIERMLELEGDPGPLPVELELDAVDPVLATVIQEALSDQEFALFSSDSGRGASGYGVALEVLSLVADVGGSVAFAAGSVHVVRRLLKVLKEHLGHDPCVSLGTATFLAAADLADRLGRTDFHLHGAGDTRSAPPDTSYTGNDCFVVIFEIDADLYVHVVDAYGKVQYLGTAKMPQLY